MTDRKNLNLYTSNRLEILADKLARILSHPLSSPMEPEIIVVQSKGMEQAWRLVARIAGSKRELSFLLILNQPEQ